MKALIGFSILVILAAALVAGCTCAHVPHVANVVQHTYIPTHLVSMIPVHAGNVTTVVPMYASEEWSLILSDGTILEVTRDQYLVVKDGDSITYESTVCR